MHAKLWIDDCEFVHAHLARTNCVSKTRRGQLGKFPDLVGARLWPWDQLVLAHTIEGILIPKFARGFDGAYDRFKVVIRAEIIAIDHRGILKVVAGQANGTFAGRLHK